MKRSSSILTFAAAAAIGVAYLRADRGRSHRDQARDQATQLGGSDTASPAAIPVADGDHTAPGVDILVGEDQLLDAYTALRTRHDLAEVHATLSADYRSLEDLDEYFRKEGAWLQAHPDVKVERVVALRDDHEILRLLRDLARAHPNFTLYEADPEKNLELRHFELYLCTYARRGRLPTRAGILVLNDALSKRTGIGIHIDANTAGELDRVIEPLETWYARSKEAAIRNVPSRSVWYDNALQWHQHIRLGSDVPFLQSYLEAEQELLSAYVDAAANEGPVAVVEFGSGTGRTMDLLADNEAPERVDQRPTLLIGLDNSPAMLDISRRNRAVHMTTSVGTSSFFFEVDGSDPGLNLWRGHLHVGDVLGDADHVVAYGRNMLETHYGAARKIVCSLLNTLGVLDSHARTDFLRGMFRAAGPGDQVLLSVFDAESFDRHAEAFYEGIRDCVLAPICRASFRRDRSEFRAGAYFSHWFGTDELVELVARAGGRVLECHGIESGNDRIGHFAVCERADDDAGDNAAASPVVLRGSAAPPQDS